MKFLKSKIKEEVLKEIRGKGGYKLCFIFF